MSLSESVRRIGVEPFLDLPILFLIVALGVIRPDTWTVFLAGLAESITIATVLTVYVPRLYPWRVGQVGGV